MDKEVNIHELKEKMDLLNKYKKILDAQDFETPEDAVWLKFSTKLGCLSKHQDKKIHPPDVYLIGSIPCISRI